MSSKDDDWPDSAAVSGVVGPSSGGRKQWRLLLVIFLVFAGFVTMVFLTQDKGSIEWITDYEAGLKLAKEANKPILLAVFKRQTRRGTLMTDRTYTDPKLREFVEDNFVPILIDVDEQPEIAKKYDTGYYPVHYVMDPELEKRLGPEMGWEGANTFVERLERFLRELNSESK